jgi:hypothetical protein
VATASENRLNIWAQSAHVVCVGQRLPMSPSRMNAAAAPLGGPSLGTLAFGQHEDRSFMMSRTII